MKKNSENEGKKGWVDLHVHTIYSDGVSSPEEVVNKALELGLRAIAITDHDCVEGVSPTIEAARGTDLEVIPGIEISAIKDNTEIHVLGYFLDWQAPFLVEALEKMRENRIERMRKILELLRKEGVEISAEHVFNSTDNGTLGRLHLARVMVKEGVTGDTKEAFDRYIGNGKPCHVRHKRLDYDKAIFMIRKAGGVPVLAHPGTMGKDEYIQEYVDAGLKGLEVYHSKHSAGADDKYLELAREYGLLVTGGSDCHGPVMKKGGVLMGKVKVGYEVVETLYREAEKIRAENEE